MNEFYYDEALSSQPDQDDLPKTILRFLFFSQSGECLVIDKFSKTERNGEDHVASLHILVYYIYNIFFCG